MSIEQDIEGLVRGCEAVYTREELAAKLKSGKRMRVKLGMDPTAPDLHLGHTVVLGKLRQFQDLGHKAVLIIGDYTAKIGDPTGKSKTRPALSDEEIKVNAATYMAQAGKILDVSAEKLEVRYNSEWLGPMHFSDVITLMAQMTVARMLERDTFEKRQKAGKEIYLHELLYPLMQAQDSVAVRSDVELGGTDQTFNNLCGRDLQRNAGQPPQLVLVMPILVGIDGHEKMSKSLGNSVGVTDEPGAIFGKIMRVPDDTMKNYFELLTALPAEEIARLVDRDQCNPRDTKEVLAKMIIERYHSRAAAAAAADEFRRVHGGGGGGLPDDVPEVSLPADLVRDGCIVPVDLLTHLTFATSRKDARRLVAERGARLNGEVFGDALAPVAVKTGDIVQRGKRRFARLIVTQA